MWSVAVTNFLQRIIGMASITAWAVFRLLESLW